VLGGKTANLQYIHEAIAPDARGNADVGGDVEGPDAVFRFHAAGGQCHRRFTTRFQMYTVPGQVMYNTTRRLVLRGADGVVFVADSQWNKMADNVESFANLEENLRLQGDSLDQIPYVLQYNKRDMPDIAPMNYLEFLLNNRGVRRPSFSGRGAAGHRGFRNVEHDRPAGAEPVCEEHMRGARRRSSGSGAGDSARSMVESRVAYTGKRVG
jgi:mutual gliding-motility protein MglA